MRSSGSWFKLERTVMSRLLAGLVTLAVVIGMAAPVSAQTIGVVLMHGNTDSPDGTTALLAAAMEAAGYLVERPETCWSYRRRCDRRSSTAWPNSRRQSRG